MARQRGFTLIELLIVIVVVATLAALAMSSYTEQVHKGRRTAAYNEIAQMQLQLERWRAENPCYGTSGANGCSNFTASGTYPTATPTDIFPTDLYYKVALGLVNATSATTYTLTATLRPAPSAQAGDRCGTLSSQGNAKPTWFGANCP